ncbi:hypothetical protein FHETE_8904 [Fusarium heterosporum]|uniref:Uncharacterized protein n=1 Tax=Fusarium heterosporum TaxID=42747 RepID=A0A8H5SV64_FUSHE|nr:hypothetical protein FHETE_8904 [Fusarium heterosporum]
MVQLPSLPYRDQVQDHRICGETSHHTSSCSTLTPRESLQTPYLIRDPDDEIADVNTEKSVVDEAMATIVKYLRHDNPSRGVSCNLLDPFNTLCESPERLRQLLRHPSAQAVGEPLFRIDERNDLLLFQNLYVDGGAAWSLANKTTFHSTSLLMALVVNGYQPNFETIYHRGQLLRSLNLDLSHSGGNAPSLQTVIAILMLISYEYRVRDTHFPTTVATHIKGLQSMIHQWNSATNGYTKARINLIQRALFWQDITCSLATGTPRLLKFDNPDVFAHLRENRTYRSYFVLPSGFASYTDRWPATSRIVFQDLHALCHLVVEMHEATSDDLDGDDLSTALSSICLMEKCDDEGYPLRNSQANLEIRLVDLLSEKSMCGTRKEEDLIYRACLFAAYLCTYRLSVGVWAGCFSPEMCTIKILDCVTRFMARISPWTVAPDISFWLLYVAGGLTKNEVNLDRAAQLMQRYRCFYPAGYDLDWEVVEMRLKKFVWCERVMKEPFYAFWERCQVS